MTLDLGTNVWVDSRISLSLCGLSKPPISKSRFCLIVQTGRNRRKVVLLCQKFPIHSCVCVLSVDMWKKIHALSFCHDIGDVPRMTGFLRLGLYKGKKKRFSRRHLGVFGTEKKDVYVCMCVYVSCVVCVRQFRGRRFSNFGSDDCWEF